VALIDQEDVERVGRWIWWWQRSHPKCEKQAGWAVAYIEGRETGLNEFLVGRRYSSFPSNGNTLDCRAGNTIHCSRSLIMQRTPKSKRKSSIYKGVSWHKKTGKWAARIQVEGKTRYLRYFRHEADAARAYDDKAREYYGEYAGLNFPISAGMGVAEQSKALREMCRRCFADMS
jgi:hypothetical protein